MQVTVLLLHWGSYRWACNLCVLIIYFSSRLCCPLWFQGLPQTRQWECFLVFGNFFLFKTPFLGQRKGGFPGGSEEHLPAMQENWIWSLGREDSPGEGNGNPLQYFLPGEYHGQRSLVGYTVHGVTKSRTWLSDFTFTFLGQSSVPITFVSLFVFYIFSYLLSKRMGCFSGCLMSSASIQKLFCGIYSAFKCFFWLIYGG